MECRHQRSIDKYIEEVRSHFKTYGLELTARILNPNARDYVQNSKIEFLDVDLSFKEKSEVFLECPESIPSWIIKSIKATAKDINDFKVN